MRISDWSSDVCSSDLRTVHCAGRRLGGLSGTDAVRVAFVQHGDAFLCRTLVGVRIIRRARRDQILMVEKRADERAHEEIVAQGEFARDLQQSKVGGIDRSEEHKSELKSLMRSWYAVSVLKKQ